MTMNMMTIATATIITTIMKGNQLEPKIMKRLKEGENSSETTRS